MPQTDPNLQIYNSPEVADHYRELDYLSAAERLLFERYIKPGDAVLDLGVGGGRTTPYLSEIASRYVGVDYAEAMVLACRSKFPGLSFLVADAADLSPLGDRTFDAVVMAFNGLDCVFPDASRRRALTEIKRVLKPGGSFIFSSHNPRAILRRPSWNPKRMEKMARDIAGEREAAFRAARMVLTLARVSLALAQACAGSMAQCLRRLTKRAFWQGEGWIFDPAHGGLTMHYAVPDRVTGELMEAGFECVEVVGDDCPRTSGPLWTGWYYYVGVTGQGNGTKVCA